MRRRALVFGVMATALLTAAVSTGQASRAETALQAAIRAETVDGDLKGAIEQYQELANGTDRAVAARALVRLGQCYEKLGSAEARQAYERAVREFADQREAVAPAQARLAALAATAKPGPTYRQVWSGPTVDVQGTVSADGRCLSFVDGETGDLALHDLVTGNDRRLTDKGSWAGEFAEASVLSRDGRQVVYAWFDGKGRYQLRTASIPAAGFLQPRTILDTEEVLYVGPYAWSPDGRWIAAAIRRQDRSDHVVIISARDGSIRTLRSNVGSEVSCRFSPDGKYLAYSASANPRGRDLEITVIPVDGSGEQQAAASPGRNMVSGWSSDGKFLLFFSDRTGAGALWAQPMAAGRASGEPLLVRQDVAPYSMGLTASNALFVGSLVGARDVHVASVDVSTGTVLAGPSKPVRTFVGENQQPDWSPDGRLLAYAAVRNPVTNDKVLALRRMATGDTRELRLNLRSFNWPRWAPDGRTLVAQGTDDGGRQGIWRIDAASGAATPVILAPEGTSFHRPSFSPDGKSLYYYAGDFNVIQRDLDSGAERTVFRGSLRSRVLPDSLSPDGRFLVAWESSAPGPPTAPPLGGSSVLRTVPMSGGEPREVIRAERPNGVGLYCAWMPDSRGLIVPLTFDGGSRRELWFVPIDGGEKRRLELDVSSGFTTALRVHPDGKQLVYVSGQQQWEVMVLENFLPPAKTAK